jgi:hypothetical protein
MVLKALLVQVAEILARKVRRVQQDRLDRKVRQGSTVRTVLRVRKVRRDCKVRQALRVRPGLLALLVQ